MTSGQRLPFPHNDGGKPSATRAESNRRQRLVEEAKRGNTNALRHGVFATVHNAPDVTTEAALIYAARPALDPIADRRLVEQLATASVQYARATVALTSGEGWPASIVAAARDFGNRAERLERAVHERHRERVREQAKPDAQDLGKYARPRSIA